MRPTISIPPGLAYGENEALPANPAGRDVRMAIAHLVHSFPGGVLALAKRSGVSANTLQHKANLNNDTHHLRVDELQLLQHATGDIGPTQALAAAEGYVCIRINPVEPTSLLDGQARIQDALAELTRAACDATASGLPVTRTQINRVEFHQGELIGAINAFGALVRNRVPRTSEDSK
ncbi:phage regulatory CII family protein [Polaromonas glacialis]|jgi:hypothetical protein|uniref:phage regulatory CII family protein n=1 Tax=Polaromonas glacialis TaxID=866564 RepID=UPI0012EB0BFF|nr:phage regulatory CII family protein [Polaromonas glacialis]